MLTACDRHPHLDRVLPTVVNKGNGLVVLQSAVDGHTRLAAAHRRLPDRDMIERFPVR